MAGKLSFTTRSEHWKFDEYSENDVLMDRIESSHKGPHQFLYEIYSAESKEAATRFLRRIPTSEIPRQYYVVVETPGGNLGKDTDGIYEDE